MGNIIYNKLIILVEFINKEEIVFFYIDDIENVKYIFWLFVIWYKFYK